MAKITSISELLDAIEKSVGKDKDLALGDAHPATGLHGWGLHASGGRGSGIPTV